MIMARRSIGPGFHARPFPPKFTAGADGTPSLRPETGLFLFFPRFEHAANLFAILSVTQHTVHKNLIPARRKTQAGDAASERI